MNTSIIYETNLDFQASCENLVKSRFVIADMTQKGILSVRFKDTRTVFLISPKGKLQVYWRRLEEKTVLLDDLKNLLVAKTGEKLLIKPRQQTMTISYGKDEFILYWCKKGIRYVRAKFTMWPFAVIALLVLVYSIFSVAESDYSLQLLNQTILNPFRVMFSPVIFVFLSLFVSYLAMKEWRKSQAGI